ncbi:MAG: hypothetical protein OEV40_10430 [Acidimicrobiia bacterium]|nr:hypothetical protein [Acidimicrobiia bacterium]
MHTLLFQEPGHFHAALLLRTRNPRVGRSIHVYATPGPDLDRFSALVTGFNARVEEPTDWHVEVHASDDPLTHLIDDRRGGSVVVAGRNQPKLATIRRLHDAGLNVLADKPWITTSAAVDDLHRVTAGPPLVMDLMTERHVAANRLRRRIVATESVFGHLIADSDELPALEFDSVHHLCKIVDGRPLRRPEWYYDVRVQGDGLVDIQSHPLDQAQWLIEGVHGADRLDRIELDGAWRWSTPVPLSLFTESTGATAFPPSLMPDVSDGVLDLACNGQIDYRLGGVRVRQRAVWRTRPPAGGGDTHRSIARGTGAEVTIQHGPATGHRPRIHVGSSADHHLTARVSECLDDWRAELPGLTMRPSPLGYELVIPAALDTPHEATFPLVLDDFLDQVDQDRWSAVTAHRIRTRYTLLARAHDEARDGPPS